MRSSHSHSRRWLILILLTYASLAVAYSIVVPLAETPDESEHFRYMQAVARTGRLPLMEPRREDNVTIEAHQPPLYYLLGAALFGQLDLDPADNPPDNPCFSFDAHDPGRKNAYLHYDDEWPPQRDLYRAFMGMRWLSILMGAAAVIVAYVIGRQVVPALPWFAAAAAALVAFNPQFIFITSSMNNDVPTMLLGAAIVALSASAIARPRLSVYVLLGIVTGLGLLTKFALIAFWPLAFLAAVWPALQITRTPFSIRFDFKGLLGRLLPVFLLPLLIAGWWYLRNYRLYGDPLLWDVTLAAKGSVIARTSPFAISDLAEFISLHFQSFWLWFGWLNIKAPDWVYALLLLVCLIAAAGLVRLALKRNVPLELSALGMNALAVLAIYASLLQYIQTINWTGYQGRLAFAALASITLFIALGLVALGGKKLAAAAAGGLLLLSLAALYFLLIPAYPRPAVYQPDRELSQVCARFDSGLQVEALDSQYSVKPGGTLALGIYGYGLVDAAQPQTISLRLLGAGGEVAGEAAARLQWRAGENVSALIDIPVRAEALPARAVLDLAMLAEDGRVQTATSATGRELAVPVGLAAVKIANSESADPAPQVATNVNFGDLLTLVGYDMESSASNWTVTLYWQAREKMALDYTTFIHLLDAEGRLLSQNDSQPAAGVYPTSIWDKGEIVADRKELRLPAGAAEMDLRLATGVYLVETLQRLPVWDGAGQRQPGDQWVLGSFIP